jgi:hypothetical protein
VCDAARERVCIQALFRQPRHQRVVVVARFRALVFLVVVVVVFVVVAAHGARNGVFFTRFGTRPQPVPFYPLPCCRSEVPKRFLSPN